MTTFRVRIGDDGRTFLTTTDFEEAHAYARELSETSLLRQAEVLSSRSGKIGTYRDGEMTGYLSGNGSWVWS